MLPPTASELPMPPLPSEHAMPIPVMFLMAPISLTRGPVTAVPLVPVMVLDSSPSRLPFIRGLVTLPVPLHPLLVTVARQSRVMDPVSKMAEPSILQITFNITRVLTMTLSTRTAPPAPGLSGRFVFGVVIGTEVAFVGDRGSGIVFAVAPFAAAPGTDAGVIGRGMVREIGAVAGVAGVGTGVVGAVGRGIDVVGVVGAAGPVGRVVVEVAGTAVAVAALSVAVEAPPTLQDGL